MWLLLDNRGNCIDKHISTWIRGVAQDRALAATGRGAALCSSPNMDRGSATCTTCPVGSFCVNGARTPCAVTQCQTRVADARVEPGGGHHMPGGLLLRGGRGDGVPGDDVCARTGPERVRDMRAWPVQPADGAVGVRAVRGVVLVPDGRADGVPRRDVHGRGRAGELLALPLDDHAGFEVAARAWRVLCGRPAEDLSARELQ